MPSIRSLLAFILLLTTFTTPTTAFRAKLWSNPNCTGDYDYEINKRSNRKCDFLDLEKPVYSVEYDSDINCHLAIFSDTYCLVNQVITVHQHRCVYNGDRILGILCGIPYWAKINGGLTGNIWP
ncbi:MAG: hypothetical protein HETSPECPRED_002961 [Heterodermia speciosa]|uniref:Effector protein n=1 Tax=Heterodermia speciosa TaxID=116794 RepID=A0A8H3F1S4_9LECA|nr:MAG: hypothetical protein HETSPECPRED_002961 [Heterodermia speciosa]